MLENDSNDFKKYLATELLRKLPGVDSSSMAKITRNVKTIVDLTRLSEDELKKVLGNKPGTTLKQFLEKKVEIVVD